MSLILKSNPVGIDIPIDTIQRALHTALVVNGSWMSYQSNHRAYINNTSEGFNPEIFVSKDEYKEVFMNDDFFVTSFFMADQDRPFPGQELFESEISIIFQVKLSKLLPGITHRADEEFNNEVSVVLDGLSGDIVFNGITQGIPNVYAEFDQSKIPWSDIQPFYVVRFDLTATYFFDCSRTFAGTICTIAVTVSGTDPTTQGGSDGTATATPSGGQGNLSFLWTTVDGSIPAGEEIKQTATGLTDGTYTVVGTDDIKESCTATDSTTLTDPPAAFIPSDVAGMQVWVMADDETSFNAGSINNLDKVTDWKRQPGSSVDFDQAVSLNRPIWNSSGFGTKNKPYVNFDGTQWLNSTFDLTQIYTVITIIEKNSNIGSDIIIASGTGTGFQLFTSGGGNLVLFNGVGVITDGNLGTVPVMTKSVSNGASGKIGKNSDAFVTGNAGTGGIIDLRIGAPSNTGAGQNGDEKIAEVIVYTGEVSSGDLSSLFTYADDKYGI